MTFESLTGNKHEIHVACQHVLAKIQIDPYTFSCRCIYIYAFL